jgi:hypothetical protein
MKHIDVNPCICGAPGEPAQDDVAGLMRVVCSSGCGFGPTVEAAKGLSDAIANWNEAVEFEQEQQDEADGPDIFDALDVWVSTAASTLIKSEPGRTWIELAPVAKTALAVLRYRESNGVAE